MGGRIKVQTNPLIMVVHSMALCLMYLLPLPKLARVVVVVGSGGSHAHLLISNWYEF